MIFGVIIKTVRVKQQVTWLDNKGKSKIETRIELEVDHYLVTLSSRTNSNIEIEVGKIHLTYADSRPKSTISIAQFSKKRVCVVDELKNQFFAHLSDNDKKELLGRILRKHKPLIQGKNSKLNNIEVRSIDEYHQTTESYEFKGKYHAYKCQKQILLEI